MLDSACHRDPVEPEPLPEPPQSGVEGIYLGVIGFNDQLYVKDISLLNSSTCSNFTNFIDGLTTGNGTALFYADYTALQKMKAYPSPAKLKNVALVTFTDGLDNISTANSSYNPEGYGSTSAYRNALHNKIVNEQIHGLNVAAYSIGLKGGDVTDEAQFMETLRKLASSDNNVFQVANMDETMARFSEIASSLYSISTSVNLGVNVPGGYDDGQRLRFTFDNVTSATSSTKFIEATYRRTSADNRTLDNVIYNGFSQGATTIPSSSSQGAYYKFLFQNLTYLDGNPISQSDLNNIKLWKQTSTGAWDKETEFNPASSTTVTEEKNSALIVLVLDCTTSLGADFARMKESAKQFVRTLANGNGGGTPTQTKPTVTTNSVSDITAIAATCGGNVTNAGSTSVTQRGVCWSTSQNPTVNNSHTTNGGGTGSFTSSITGLSANTTYYVRAYATNAAGTAYGEQRSFTTTTPFTCGSTVYDYDNNPYNTEQIGQQCWMKENLRTTHYADGTSILHGSTISTTTAYYYYPNNSNANVSTYGLLYNWKAVMRNTSSSSSNPSGVQGICPNGWHVPSDAEWTQLTNFVSGQNAYLCSNNTEYIAKALASTTGWNISSNTCAVGNIQSSNNATGFGAMPAGYYLSNGYPNFGNDAYFWSATEASSGNAWIRYLDYNDATVYRRSRYKYYGYSVRCLRD